jgi:hypothetical protein
MRPAMLVCPATIKRRQKDEETRYETCASLTPVSSLGGSIKDDESIAAANENGIAMAFT